MSWALWLAVPVGVTVLAALWSWVRSRPPRVPDTAAAMRAHTAYLEALGASAAARRPPTPARAEPSHAELPHPEPAPEQPPLEEPPADGAHDPA